jgi:ribosomal protein S8
MFPIMIINQNSLSYFINNFRIATAKKKLYFDVQLTSRSLSLCQIFYNLNLIRRFTRLNSTTYRLYPSYSISRNSTRKIKTYLKSSHYLTLSVQVLKLLNLNLPTSYIILETSKGIITHKEALKYKVGGRLLICIF